MWFFSSLTHIYLFCFLCTENIIFTPPFQPLGNLLLSGDVLLSREPGGEGEGGGGGGATPCWWSSGLETHLVVIRTPHCYCDSCLCTPTRLLQAYLVRTYGHYTLWPHGLENTKCVAHCNHTEKKIHLYLNVLQKPQLTVHICSNYTGRFLFWGACLKFAWLKLFTSCSLSALKSSIWRAGQESLTPFPGAR